MNIAAWAFICSVMGLCCLILAFCIYQIVRYGDADQKHALAMLGWVTVGFAILFVGFGLI